MATIAELSAALETLTASFTDFSDDVTAALEKNQAAMAAMQATLESALADDAADEAMIASLQAQLDEMRAGTDSALARVHALDDAVKAADVAVDRPAD